MRTQPHKPVEIGLTGGIASGKSSVAGFLREQGITVIDLDELGHRITSEDPEVVKKMGALAGPQVVRRGTLDRRALREICFSDPKVKEKIEKLLHPAILKRYQEERDRAFERGARMVVCEAALLIEHGWSGLLDALVVVFAPGETRKKRLLQRDGVSPTLADQMIASQTDDLARRSAATFVLDNDGSLQSLKKKTHGLIEEFRRRKWID